MPTTPGSKGYFHSPSGTWSTTCEDLEQVTLSLPIVYLTQAIQSPSRGVRLIAGREALLRVLAAANEPRAFFEPEVVATFTLSGEETHRVVMQRNDDQIPTRTDESDLTLSYNALIPGDVIVPGAEMVVEFDPGETVPLAPGSEARFPATGGDSLRVVEAPPMSLTAVPVLEASMGKASMPEVAHEVGHNLDLRHAPCGGAGGPDPTFPYPDGSIGMWAP